MLTTSTLMPRKRKSYNLDERTIEALAVMARSDNLSANRFLENLLFNAAQQRGVLPMSAKPLGETRGGDFTSGKKKNTPTEEPLGNAT